MKSETPPELDDELLLSQLTDILYADDGISSEERSLALAAIMQALKDIEDCQDNLTEDNMGRDAIEWIAACNRNEGGFGYYVGKLGRKPEMFKQMIYRWIKRGCKPLGA